MAVKPAHVFIDGMELSGYTDLKLTRKKQDMTGQVDIEIFMSFLPADPLLVPATKGKQLLIYIGGHLAFTGKIDRRTDATGTLNIDSYTVTFTARGSTKYLIDSSHQLETTTLLRTTSKQAIEQLIKPWGIELDWDADEDELDKVRLRDGGRVGDEIQRIAEMCSLYIYETRDGKLKVVDNRDAREGEQLILGQNILGFTAEQNEDQERQEITVKGQRIEKGKFGNDAAIPTLNKVRDAAVASFATINVQLYGNATPRLLEKRGQYEANKRAVQAKKVTVDVFHVQQTDGNPWDIGTMHYVEIPPAGVFDVLQVLEIAYTIKNDKTLQTSLTMGPPTVKSVQGADGAGATGTGGANTFLSDVPEVDDVTTSAETQRAIADVSFGSGVEFNWSGPRLSSTGFVELDQGASRDFLSDVPEGGNVAPAMTLPTNFGGR